MDLSQFIKEYENKFVHYDTVYGAQCMDLARVYVREVLGDQYQFPPVGIAYEVWNKYPKAHYDRIKNSPTNFPLPGSIVLWHWAYGGTGHIAVAAEGCDRKTLLCVTQNDPKNSPTIIKRYKYNWMVLGWLQPIPSNS